jgi:CHRD domain-containing protein
MSSTFKALVIAAAAILVVSSATVLGAGQNSFSTRLSGFNETPLTIVTTGTGSARVRISGDGQSLTYWVTYSGLEGAVTQSHIHVGQPATSGGVSIFFCSNLGNGPAGTPACPASGTVTRTVSAADVIGPAGQGVAAGEWADLLKAIRAGATYANVHSTIWPTGEIRGQLKSSEENEQ